MRKKRAHEPQATEEPLPVQEAPFADVPMAEGWDEEAPKAPPEAPGGVDGYLRRQVMSSIYGTESPTDYERKLQAIRNML